MAFEDYWYVVAESHELGADAPLARTVLNERLVCFRGASGAPVALRDRCLHRHAPLSAGRVIDGQLHCPYHGWTYDASGRVVAIPSMGPTPLQSLCNAPYLVREQEGYVYVRLNRSPSSAIEPFRMPHFRARGWRNLRLTNRFHNTVTNCVENFIDVPHTAFVHGGIFRSSRGERIRASIVREQGAVRIRYHDERANLGTYRWFLNPKGQEIRHTDSFYVPNITSVRYDIGAKTFIITSQAVPVTERETLVYTELTFTFGPWTALAAPFVRRHGQRIIDQDMEILARQMENIDRYGADFRHTPSDRIHSLVESLREAIERDEDPVQLTPVQQDIEFFV
jgi:phenylpropionate dioxygenase-like ring-hydroxylating dioxygenase large terminal subunit